MTPELRVISSGDFTAKINPLGAELWSLRDVAGRELMTDADPRWWTGRAPILFPFVGRCRDDRYRLNGREYEMPQHGFARRRQFSVVELSKTRAAFRLEADAETRLVYPFEFSLEIAFELDGAGLAIGARVANEGDTAMPFSFGFHPAFAWPLPYGAAACNHRILFEKPELAPLRKIDRATGLVATDTRSSPVDGDLLAPTHAMFEGDALIWNELDSRSLLWGAPGSPNLRIAFPDMNWLGIWQKPGAHFLCIEPWAGMADPVGFAGEVWDKPGVMGLPAGEARVFRLHLSLE